MRCSNPSINEPGILTAERIRGQANRWWNGGDPVQPVKNSETVYVTSPCLQSVRKKHQRYTA